MADVLRDFVAGEPLDVVECLRAGDGFRARPIGATLLPRLRRLSHELPDGLSRRRVAPEKRQGGV
jgi:hypothetical protein